MRKILINAALCWFRPWMAGIAALVLVAALFIGGGQPGATSLIKEPWDKLLHAGYFFTLTVLFWRALGHRPILSLALAVLAGALDELHQGVLPGRTMGLDDWLADLVGGLIALAAIRWLVRSLGELRPEFLR